MGYGSRGGGGRGRQEYDNSNSVTVWTNEDARGDNDPAFKGTAEVDGVEYWAAAWTAKQKDGRRRINIKLTPKEDKSPQQRNRERGESRGRNKDDFDDDDQIPF